MTPPRTDVMAKKWRKSPYPFKSPHWKNRMGQLFNILSDAVGDPIRVPSPVPWGEKPSVYREQPQYVEISEKVMRMLNQFSELPNYTDLATLERVLPLRYTYLLPARQGVVVYAAYSAPVIVTGKQIGRAHV